MSVLATTATPTIGSRPSRRLLIALATVAGSGLVAAGVVLPWLSYYAGLFQLSALGTTNGNRLLAMAAGGAVLAVVAAVRPRPALRFAIALLGSLELLFSAHLLSQLNATLGGAGEMIVAKRGPGLYVALAGGLLTFGTVFLPYGRGSPAGRVTRRPGTLVAGILSSLRSMTRRDRMQMALGLVWLADAALQSQPFMFTRAFARSTLAGAASNSPRALSSAGALLGRLVTAQPVLSNELFVAIELVIAVLLLRPRTAKAGLVASGAWGLVVFVFGEGVGQVLAPQSTPFSGAPGAGTLYVLLAVLLWPAQSSQSSQLPTPRTGPSVAESSPAGTRGSRVTVCCLFTLLAVEAWPRSGMVNAASRMFLSMRNGEPAWLSSIDASAASWLGHDGAVVLVLASVALLAVGVALGRGGRACRPAVALGLVLAAALFVSQDFGGVATGAATDVGTAPLLALVLCSFWPSSVSASTRTSTGTSTGTGTEALAASGRPGDRTVLVASSS